MFSINERSSLKDFIEENGDKYPLFKEFKNTQQDKIFHAEGNNYIHTSMVLDECYKLLGENPLAISLTDSEKKVLVYSVLFHDYAKPVTTKEVERYGRTCIVASGHEDVAASLMLYLDTPSELTDDEWLSVIKLVAYHQMPKKAVKKVFSYGKYVELLRHCGDFRLLYLLEIADMKGRICEDLEGQLLDLELFREECENFGLFSSYDDFAQRNLDPVRAKLGENALYKGLSDLAEGKIHSIDTIEHMPYAFKKRPEIILMCGLPASGKSLYAGQNFPDHQVVSLDSVRKELYGKAEIQGDKNEVVRVALEKLREHFRTGVNVVYDTTAFRKDFMERVTGLAHKYDYVSKVVVMSVPFEECVKRNRGRDRVVPIEVMKEMHERFQMPSLESVHALQLVRGA